MTGTGGGRGWVTAAAFVVPVAFLAVFFAIPAGTILDLGLRGDGGWDTGAVVDVLGDRVTREVAWFTLWQAAVSTAATVAAALPAAWVLGRLRVRGRALFSAALVVWYTPRPGHGGVYDAPVVDRYSTCPAPASRWGSAACVTLLAPTTFVVNVEIHCSSVVSVRRVIGPTAAA